MRYLAALLVAVVLLAATSCCDPREACGKVTAKVWSHITGECYVIAQNTSWPSETLYIECDTLDFPGIVVGQVYCGEVLSGN